MIKFGEIDANQILDNEFRIGVLELLLEHVINNNTQVQIRPETVTEIRTKVLERLRSKYPNSGLEIRK